VLRKHDDFFTAARTVPARSAILYNGDALTLYLVDGWRRPNDEVMHSLMGCYKALHRAHVPVDFLGTSALESGKASAYKVLYLPYSFALSAKSVAAIREFVRNGGTVWADGLVGWKDEQGNTKQLPPGPLSDVFGFTLDDIEAEGERFSLTGGSDKAGELWRCLIPSGQATTLLPGPGGRPAAVEHRFGKGRAIYYGTGLTFHSLRHDDPTIGGWIAAPAVEASRDLPIRLLEGPDRLSLRILQAPGRMAAVFNNWGAAGEAVLNLPASARSASELLSGQSIPLRRTAASSEARIGIAAGGSAILMVVTG
jgi:hypothetical protein